MKKRNILRTAKAIENTDYYDLSDDCNCIAAHAVRVNGGRPSPWGWWGTRGAALEFLGLTENQANKLFYKPSSWESGFDWRCRNTTLAARMLRRFAKTGRIIWR